LLAAAILALLTALLLVSRGLLWGFYYSRRWSTLVLGITVLDWVVIAGFVLCAILSFALMSKGPTWPLFFPVAITLCGQDLGIVQAAIEDGFWRANGLFLVQEAASYAGVLVLLALAVLIAVGGRRDPNAAAAAVPVAVVAVALGAVECLSWIIGTFTAEDFVGYFIFGFLMIILACAITLLGTFTWLAVAMGAKRRALAAPPDQQANDLDQPS
jgi:hypothetical protein